MQCRSAPSLVIVKREEKEGKLKEFIDSILQQQMARSGAEAGLVTAQWSVVARSLESPVVKALQSIAERVGSLKVRLAIALLEPTGHCGQGEFEQISRIHRHLADPRHLNAHEQLILGPAACWVGDCMRREPAKRDAYEQFAPDCPLTAQWAATGFERLWAASSSLVRPGRTLAIDIEPASEAAVAVALGGPGEMLPPVLASTRH